MAQTALGMQIRNLEEELGVTLLERHSRGVTATPAGEVLNRYADDVISLLNEARQAMRPFQGGTDVQVSLGLTPSIMRLVGDDILVELAKTIPTVSLRLVEEFSFVLMRLLQQGELTAALTFAPDDDPAFVRTALLEEELCYLVAADLAPPEDTIAFRKVLTADLALTGRDDAVFRLVDGIARSLSMELKVAYEVQSIRAVKNLVAKGIAATIMPYGAAEGELRSGVLKARLIVAPSVIRTLFFVYPKDRGGVVETPEFRRFVEAVAQRLAASPGPVIRLL